MLASGTRSSLAGTRLARRRPRGDERLEVERRAPLRPTFVISKSETSPCSRGSNAPPTSAERSCCRGAGGAEELRQELLLRRREQAITSNDGHRSEQESGSDSLISGFGAS